MSGDYSHEARLQKMEESVLKTVKFHLDLTELLSEIAKKDADHDQRIGDLERRASKRTPEGGQPPPHKPLLVGIENLFEHLKSRETCITCNGTGRFHNWDEVTIYGRSLEYVMRLIEEDEKKHGSGGGAGYVSP
jgi:DNA repair exonuclease SbcCD ATPase subunit